MAGGVRLPLWQEPHADSTCTKRVTILRPTGQARILPQPVRPEKSAAATASKANAHHESLDNRPVSTPAPDRDWPAHTQQVLPWRQTVRRGPRLDREVDQITVNLPPFIAQMSFPAQRPLMAMVNASVGGMGHLDLVHGRTLEALGHLQLRTESVDSSKIENIEAGLADYGRAMLGVGASASARSMAAATSALVRMIDDAKSAREVRLEALLQAHQDLFARHPDEHQRAGRIRVGQNWVGGSDYSPRNALWVPPPPQLVPAYLDDLFTFANRADLPTLVQAAIAHAQFESIHPFIDGNGRLGRALIQAILRRRRATRHLTIPIASALVAHRERYFAALTAYRAGSAAPIIALLARSASLATDESWRAATEIEEIRQRWQETAPARPGQPAYRLMDLLTEAPIVNVASVSDQLRITTDESAAAIEELTRVRVLQRAPRTWRAPVWLAFDVLREVEALSARTQEASRRLAEPLTSAAD